MIKIKCPSIYCDRGYEPDHTSCTVCFQRKSLNAIHLNLIGKWFDLIYSGEKFEEYRDIKPSWTNCFEKHDMLKKVEVVIFSNGYRKDRRQFIVELQNLSIGQGNTEWGAEKGKDYYVLKLGRILVDNFDSKDLKITEQ